MIFKIINYKEMMKQLIKERHTSSEKRKALLGSVDVPHCWETKLLPPLCCYTQQNIIENKFVKKVEQKSFSCYKK